MVICVLLNGTDLLFAWTLFSPPDTQTELPPTDVLVQMAGCVTPPPTEMVISTDPVSKPKSETEVTKNRIDTNNTLWVPIQNVNQYITCGICRGYLYEASTITECMHSCKSVGLECKMSSQSGLLRHEKKDKEKGESS
ncbi:hypothetical protein BaRGS_00020471 [Batillaria attramentaria]|uniref:Uncharacterized protein n=1 Tax=Batillaria attramentaria TaxID=370345 RepID=A0ABD0KMC3_9CAEN